MSGITAQEAAPPAYQAGAWVSLGGPSGGLGYDIRMDPRNPDVMYVTDAWAGVFKSTDGGATWFASNNGLTPYFGPSGDAIPIFSLTIDPNNPDTLWVGTQYASGIGRSDDAGATWRQINPGANGIQEEFISIRGFAVESGNSDVVYFAGEVSSWEWNGEPLPGLGLDMTKGVVYKSVDGGQNWTRLWLGDNLARYIWIHPQDHNLIYVSTGIFDREAANSNADAIDPGGVGILRSRDGGQSWDALGVDNGIRADELYFGSLFMHPDNPDILLGAAGNDPYMWALGHPVGAIYRSEDGGGNWQRVLGLPNASAVEICRGNPEVVYAGSLDGVYRSDDGGASWQQTGAELWGPEDIVAGFPIDMQCDPRDPMRIFINNYGGGNYLSQDGGVTWVNASHGYTGAMMRQVVVADDNPGLVYATARSGVFVSADGGENWQGMSRGPARAMEAAGLAVDPENSQHVLAVIGDAGPVPKVTFDGGKTWQEVDDSLWRSWQPGPGDLSNQIVFSPHDPQRVLALPGDQGCWTRGSCADGRGVIFSADGGQTWQQSGLVSVQVTDLAFAADKLVYAAVYSGDLYRSGDGGQTWEQVAQAINGGIPLQNPEPDMPGPALTALAVDPADPHRLYAGLFLGGVMISQDGGVTWQPSAAGMSPEASVSDIQADAAHPRVVYAATSDSGVFVSTDSGANWTPLNEGLLTRAGVDLALAADGSVLYLATEGGGVFRLGTPTVEAATVPVLSMPEAVPSTAVPPEPAPSAGGSGLCGGTAVLPLVLLGLVWMQRRRRWRDGA
ncbi:MAG: WD40/YVTN/BNR-like repeat-containing protein [Anaerolineae bacterium]